MYSRAVVFTFFLTFFSFGRANNVKEDWIWSVETVRSIEKIIHFSFISSAFRIQK